MTAKLDNATALYLEGIQQGRAREAVEAYTGDRYTQHSTGVRDGVEGFVEHWDVISEWVDVTVSGHSQIGGPTEVTDLDTTDQNKATIAAFIEGALVHGQGDSMTTYVSSETCIQHSPKVADGIEGVSAFNAGDGCCRDADDLQVRVQNPRTGQLRRVVLLGAAGRR